MKFKSESTSKYLERKFGGKWRYDRKGSWHCNDGNRYVRRVLTATDMNGEYTEGSSLCLYYGDSSRTPEWVY